MPRNKDKTLSIHTTTEVKSLLQLAAARERRSIASMIEILVLTCASEHELNVDTSVPRRAIQHGRDALGEVSAS
jgi:hypothetical protein